MGRRTLPEAGSPGGTAVELRGVTRQFGRGRNAVRALEDVSLAIASGSFTAIMGPSGSGKSTLMQCAAGLDRPTRGSVWFGDIELSKLKEPKLTEVRREQIGYVFQAFNLLPSLNAIQNIELPLKLAGLPIARDRIQRIVETVGIADLLRQRPAELSGGQQQRIAIARALAAQPRVIFADEPTGALDLRTGRDILHLFRASVDELAQTVIMVTHDPAAASFADRVVFLADGQIVDEMTRPTAAEVSAHMNQLER